VTEAERGRPILSGRRIPVRAVAVTAAAAFVIAVGALTTIDLVSGGSVGKGSGRTTFFSGDKGGASDSPKQQEQDATPQRQESPEKQQNQPTEPTTTSPQPEEQTPSETAPVPPPSDAPPGEPQSNSTP
jgi:outer membrane biosynthesis protein TonB